MSDKRRGAGSGPGGSSSHLLRTTPATTSSSSGSQPNRGSNTGGGNIIAPPPRAALGHGSASSSPPPDVDPPNGVSSKDTSGPSGPGGGGSGGSSSSSHAATAATAAAVTHLVKEKDLRIAALERELAVMEAEFTRELDKLSQNESETASFWQAKHGALNQQFLRADTELRLLRAEVELREAERDELRAGWEGLRRDAAAREDEARRLRQQVRGLKDFVSTSTRTGGQTSDEVFGEGMARLGNGLQNWIIVNFRRAKLDVSKASKSSRDELARLVPMYQELMHTAKVHLLQSVVSRLLVELVFGAYFVGLSPEQTRQFSQMEAFLSSIADSSEPVNQWRAHTLAILKAAAPQTLAAETARVADDVVARVNSLLDAVTDTRATEARSAALRGLVAAAVELARSLVVQKAVLRVSMPEILPHQRVVFDPATMEDIGGEDEEGLARRDICCVTFPGIIKRGDENGGHMLQYTNVIVKARVLCSPE